MLLALLVPDFPASLLLCPLQLVFCVILMVRLVVDVIRAISKIFLLLALLA